MLRKLMVLIIAMAMATPVMAVHPANDRFSDNIYIRPFSQLKHHAQLGDPEAQYNLAYMYYSAKKDDEVNGIIQSNELAARWYRKAALQGHSGAQYNMAVLHINGQGVERNVITAYAWLMIASENGHKSSRDLSAQLGAEMSSSQRATARQERENLIKRIRLPAS